MLKLQHLSQVLELSLPRLAYGGRVAMWPGGGGFMGR